MALRSIAVEEASLSEQYDHRHSIATNNTDASDPRAIVREMLSSGVLTHGDLASLGKELGEDQSHVRFSVDAGLIDRLGRELVAKQETAVAELIKNAYDADATKVIVTFEGVGSSGGRLTISDDGSGMDRQQLVNGFMRISTTSKHGSDRSPRFGRPRAGQKGIGRFSAQRLGERLILSTRPHGAESALVVDLAWEEFRPDTELTGVSIPLREVRSESIPPGTHLDILRLREAWSDPQIMRVYRYVLGLLRPTFRPLITIAELVQQGALLSEAQKKDFSPVPDTRADHDTFEVEFLWDRGDGELRGLDDESMFLEHAVAQFEVVVDERARAFVRVEANRWQISEFCNLPAPSDSGWVLLAGKVILRGHYFIHEPSLVPKLFASRVKEILTESGGFQIFRNGFRVLPYGAKGDDWAELDLLSRRRTFLPPVANLNWLGAVLIEDEVGNGFVETASREGLIETSAFLELRQLVDATARHVAQRVAEARDRKVRAGSKPRRPSSERLRDAADRIRRRAQQGAGQAETPREKDAWRAILAAVEEVHAGAGELANEHQETLDEVATLRILAALGIAIGEFTHEIRHLVGEISNHLDALEHARHLGEIRGMPARAVEGLTKATRSLLQQASYFDRAIADQAQREVQPQDLRQVLFRFHTVFSPRAEKCGVALDIASRGEDLRTAPMHEAEWMSILLNLYSNAERAVLQLGDAKQVRLECRRSGDEVVLRCSDTGVGVPLENRERIFHAFFTTTKDDRVGPDGSIVQGTGLGLHIVRQIVEARGGSVRLLQEPMAGYSTTFEVRVPAERKGALK